MTPDDSMAMFDLGVAIGTLNARVEALKAERDEAIAVIRKADSMVTGYADRDYEIAVEVLRPFLARYPEGAA